jgi:hypothetical protein
MAAVSAATAASRSEWPCPRMRFATFDFERFAFQMMMQKKSKAESCLVLL